MGFDSNIRPFHSDARRNLPELPDYQDRPGLTIQPRTKSKHQSANLGIQFVSPLMIKLATSRFIKLQQSALCGSLGGVDSALRPERYASLKGAKWKQCPRDHTSGDGWF
jgi:hypothetical protein